MKAQSCWATSTISMPYTPKVGHHQLSGLHLIVNGSCALPPAYMPDKLLWKLQFRTRGSRLRIQTVFYLLCQKGAEAARRVIGGGKVIFHSIYHDTEVQLQGSISSISGFLKTVRHQSTSSKSVQGRAPNDLIRALKTAFVSTAHPQEDGANFPEAFKMGGTGQGGKQVLQTCAGHQLHAGSHGRCSQGKHLPLLEPCSP